MYVWLFGVLRNQSLAAGAIGLSLLFAHFSGAASRKWRYSVWLLTGFFLLLPPFNNEQTAAFLVHFLNPADIQPARGRWLVFAFLCLWGIIAVILLVSDAVRHIFFIRKMKASSFMPERQLLSLFRTSAAALNLSQPPKLLVNPDAAGPLTFGIISPTVILDRTDYSETEQKIIFLHELLHVRRHDVLAKSFLQILKDLFWLNPAIHLMARTADLDMECLCDSEVILRMGNDYRRPYAELLLKTAGSSPAKEFLSLLGPSGRRIKTRIGNLWAANKIKTTLLPAVCIICMFIFGSVILAAAVDCAFYHVPDPVLPEMVWETPEVLASNEWNDFYLAYTKYNIPENDVPVGEAGQLCLAGYSVYDETMAGELKRIAGKYGLTLHTEFSAFKEDPERYFGDLFSGKGALLSGYYHEDGSLYLSGNYNYDDEIVSVSVIRTVKGVLSDVYPTSLCRKEWGGKTAHTGDNILYEKVISPEFPESGYLIFYTETALLTLAVRSNGCPMTEALLETMANEFAYENICLYGIKQAGTNQRVRIAKDIYMIENGMGKGI